MTTHLKIKNLNAILITALIIAIAAPLVVAENTQLSSGQGTYLEEPKYPDIPGAPDNAIQYNKTDVIPVEEREQVRAGEPALFQYRNMTMLMNCSQNCEVIFNSDSEVTPKTLSLTVEPNQTMTLTMNMSNSPLYAEAALQKTLNFYLGIEPNATIQLQAQLRLHINQTELNSELNREVNASRLTWMFWNQTNAKWQAVESYMDQNGYLVCNTNHFSSWTVAEIEQTSESTPEQTNMENGITPTLLIAAGIITLIVIGVIALKKHK